MVFIFSKERTMQKNRFSRLPKIMKLNYGNAGFITEREGRLELIQLSFLKKRIKKLIQKVDKRFEIQREQVWFYITTNFLIQKKSKNSRMGKGKGLVERRAFRIRRNVPLFEFYGLPFSFLKKILIKINKKLNLKLYMLHYEIEKTNF